MKTYIKIITLFTLALFSLTPVQAQDDENTESSSEDSFQFKTYFGFELASTEAANINPFLSESEVPTIRNFPLGFAFGFTTRFNHNRIDLDFSFYTQERERNEKGHKVNGANLGLRYLREVYESEKSNVLALGGTATYFVSNLEFYDKNETIDLSEPGSFGDVAKLDNNQFYVGPTLAYSIFTQKTNKEEVRFQLTYELNLTRNSWSSDYARVSNSISETGNRLRLQIILPF
jgi:hypothetical protein